MTLLAIVLLADLGGLALIDKDHLGVLFLHANETIQAEYFNEVVREFTLNANDLSLGLLSESFHL